MPIPTFSRAPHADARPSATAQWMALGRALELRRPPAQRIVTDEFAPLFLTPAGSAMLAALRSTSPLVRVVERQEFAGLSAFALCRHRYIDDKLAAALEHANVDQVLILGAGYDARAYRFAEQLRGRPVHEVDLAAVSRRKAEIVAGHPGRFGHTRVRRVEVDFRIDSLAERLLGSGFAVGARTFVVWEGVTMYLDEASIQATLRALRDVCGSGSLLAIDLWDGHGGADRLAPVRRLGARAISVIGEPVRFGVAEDKIAAFLRAEGFEVQEVAGAATLTERYSTDRRPTEKSIYILMAKIG